ncbi:hypothetical protein ETAR_17510 [Edwardsiella tarda]
MSNDELKHVIALLLEDAKRLQRIEPNAGTESRILLAQQILGKGNEYNPAKERERLLLDAGLISMAEFTSKYGSI